MRKIEERIFNYLDNNLSPSETEKFERELSENAELKKEFELISRRFKNLKELRDIRLDDNYFSSLTTRFRNSEQKNSIYIFKPAYAAVAMILIALAANILLNKDITTKQVNTINQIEENLSADEYYSFILQEEMFLEEITNVAEIDSGLNEQIEDLIQNELNTESVQDYIADNSDFLPLTINISDSEADEIYSQLINKKIF